MPDSTLAAALQEAYASAPADDIVYHTLEFRHASFAEPIRVVRDHADLAATLEADAPLNGGEEVTFIAYAFDDRPPEVAPDAPPVLEIEIDNVARDILAAVETAMSTTDLVEVTYRTYLASDLSAPQNDPPMTLTVSRISADLMRVRATAGFDDLANRRYPLREYSAETHPGLVQQ